MMRKKERGNTLVEVVIAVLLTAVMVSAIFSVAMTTKQAGGKSEKKVIASQAARQLTMTLRNYITGDNTMDSFPNAPCVPGDATHPAAGPADCGQSWSMTAPLRGVTDTCPPGAPNGPNNCYALYPGTHTLKGFLPSWFETGYQGTISYYVVGTVTPQVSVTVNWTEY